MERVTIKAKFATPENTEQLGFFIGEDVRQERIPIPFYDHVDEGQNIPFEYTGKAVLRTARIHPTEKPNIWLERHMDMTQFFIGLGKSRFAMLLADSTHHLQGEASNAPSLDEIVCYIFEGGTGILLNKGVWHDFPMAIDQPVTCITGNSDEVVKALVEMDKPGEMDQGDVFKINLVDRLGIEIVVEHEE